MNSCIYLSKISHERKEPKKNSFSYSIYMMYIDLDELADLDRNHFMFGCNKSAIFSFQDRDHFKFLEASAETAITIASENVTFDSSRYKDLSLKEKVATLLGEAGFDFKIGKVCMLTNPRNFGYVFNPVSFYFCFDADGVFRAMLSEVNNTFLDQKMYIARIDNPEAKSWDIKQRKNYYISPFISHENILNWRFGLPGERLAMAIDSLKEGRPELATVLAGRRMEISARSFLYIQFRYPLQTLAVIILIHYQALKLFFKGVKFWRKQAADRDIAFNIKAGRKPE